MLDQARLEGIRVRTPVVAVCDGALAGLSPLYLTFAYVVAEYGLPYIPICPLFLATGTPCPLCGSTRMIGAFLHGDLSLSMWTLPSLMWFAFVLSVAVMSIARVIGNWRKRQAACLFATAETEIDFSLHSSNQLQQQKRCC
ncbi:MAG: DUF2752 domain-containing protein [Rhodocyclaceae bacterium]|nr:DUF2752 domain-containing protein [Rhodocyclaceae bacterium]